MVAIGSARRFCGERRETMRQDDALTRENGLCAADSAG
jgi:hypothetical protein